DTLAAGENLEAVWLGEVVVLLGVHPEVRQPARDVILDRLAAEADRATGPEGALLDSHNRSPVGYVGYECAGGVVTPPNPRSRDRGMDSAPPASASPTLNRRL